MRPSVRLIGQSRAFTKNLRKILEDCGLQTQVEKGARNVTRPRRSPAINIFEVKTRVELSNLSRMSSTKPFLIYTTMSPPPARLAPLKAKGLVGILRREALPEEIAFLVNSAFFYNRVLRRNRRALVNFPVVLKTEDTVLTTFATNLSK